MMISRILASSCVLTAVSCTSSWPSREENRWLTGVEANVERVQYKRGDLTIVAHLTISSAEPLCISLDEWLFGGGYKLVSASGNGLEARRQATYMVAWGSGRYVFNFSNFRLAEKYEIVLSAFDCRLFGEYDDPAAELVAQNRVDEFVPILLHFEGIDMTLPKESDN